MLSQVWQTDLLRIEGSYRGMTNPALEPIMTKKLTYSFGCPQAEVSDFLPLLRFQFPQPHCTGK